MIAVLTNVDLIRVNQTPGKQNPSRINTWVTIGDSRNYEKMDILAPSDVDLSKVGLNSKVNLEVNINPQNRFISLVSITSALSKVSNS